MDLRPPCVTFWTNSWDKIGEEEKNRRTPRLVHASAIMSLPFFGMALKSRVFCVDDGTALLPAAVSVWLCGVTEYPSYILGTPPPSQESKSSSLRLVVANVGLGGMWKNDKVLFMYNNVSTSPFNKFQWTYLNQDWQWVTVMEESLRQVIFPITFSISWDRDSFLKKGTCLVQLLTLSLFSTCSLFYKSSQVKLQTTGAEVVPGRKEEGF